MSITKIDSEYRASVSQALVDDLGIRQDAARALVEDGEISGAELWSHFMALQAITRHCAENSRCYLLYSKNFFNKLGRACLNAAGSNQTIDAGNEVVGLKNAVHDLMEEVKKGVFEVVAQQDYGLGGLGLPAPTILALRGVPPSEIPRIVRSTLVKPEFYANPTRNKGIPNTVVLFTHLPVSVDRAFDFLVRTADEFDDRTTLYEETHITKGRRPASHEGEGHFDTFVKVDVPYNFSTPSFRVRNFWSRMGESFGPNSNAFIYRFSLIPGSTESSLGLEVTALEGVVIARPTSEGGTVVEFHLDFDFSLIPDFILDWLMSGEIKKFVGELATALHRLSKP